MIVKFTICNQDDSFEYYEDNILKEEYDSTFDYVHDKYPDAKWILCKTIF